MQYEVYEGDKVTLTAVNVEKEVDFIIFGPSGESTAKGLTHDLTFEPVPAGKESYVVSWKYKLAEVGEISGEDTYRVWPKLLKLKVKMKEGAKGSVEGFTFSLIQGEETKQPTVEANGEWSGALLKMPYEIGAVSPWVLEKNTPSQERAAEHTLEISQTPWTAKIVSQRSGTAQSDPHKQYVNLPDEASTEKGSLLNVEVKPHDPKLGLKGQKISVRVTFEASNSLRTTPRPTLVVNNNPLTSTNPNAKPGQDALIYETQLALGAHEGSVKFDVQLGYAGGDQCLIEVGFDDGFGDDKLYVQNWRRLESEFIVPERAIRQSWDNLVNNDDNDPQPAQALQDELKKILEPLYIELLFPQAFRKVYTANDIDQVTGARGGAQTFVIDAPKLKPSMSGKWTFLAPSDLDALRDRVTNNAPQSPLRLMMVLVDQMPKTLGEDDVTLASVSPGQYYNEFDQATKDDEIGKDLERGKPPCVLLRNPIATGAADLWGLEKASWTISGWRKRSKDAWNEGGFFAIPFDDQAKVWPQNLFGEFQEMVPGNQGDVDEWVEFVHMKKVKMKLPNRLHQYFSKGGYEFRLQVLLDLRHFNTGANANALRGKIRLTTMVGMGTPAGVARTLAHEIGHNLGHAYFENKGKATDNRGRVPSRKIPGVDFEPTVPNGAFYAGKGHKGAHCAYGIKMKDPKLLDEEKFTSKDHTLDSNCVLYGQGNQNASTEFKYCPLCTKYILASDARDITTDWKKD